MLRFLICSFVLLVSGAVVAAPPVVVEFFGHNTCQSDTDIQRQFVSLLEEYDDLIIVNCRQWYGDTEAQEANLKHSHKFCKERSRAYSKRLHDRGFMVVNGRWSANYKQPDAAVKLARLDGVVSAELSLNDEHNSLKIRLPNIDRVVNGQVYVYAYAPTESDFVYSVNPDVELTDELRERMRSGESVPFVTRTEKSQYMFRPVLARSYVGTWAGAAVDIDFDVNELLALTTEVRAVDVSYVVLVQDGDGVGPVIASGEIVSFAEQAYLFPKSAPVTIERVSKSDSF